MPKLKCYFYTRQNIPTFYNLQFSQQIEDLFFLLRAGNEHVSKSLAILPFYRTLYFSAKGTKRFVSSPPKCHLVLWHQDLWVSIDSLLSRAKQIIPWQVEVLPGSGGGEMGNLQPQQNY